MSCCSKSDKPKSGPLKISGNKSNEFKVVLIGDRSVGKTSIAQRFKQGVFNEGYELTIGGAYLKKTINLTDGRSVNMHLWDTGGEERYRAMVPLYYRDSQAAILVYDICDAATFKSLDYWINELQEKVKTDGMIILIVGNKCDKSEERKVSKEMAQSLSSNNNVMSFETSAKTGEGVNELFEYLGQKLYDESIKKQGV